MAAQGRTRNHDFFALPSTTVEYEYQGKQHLLDVVERTRETSWKETHIIFTGLDPQTFEHEIENTDCRRINQSFDTYLPQFGLLLLEMPASDVHETTSNRLNLMIMEALPRRLRRALSMRGETGYQSATRQKCADQAYVPKRLPSGRSNHWPSMVIECGWSETRAKLERDCRWWLHDSDGDVKIALSISVHMRRKQIIIQKWESFQLQTRAGQAQTGERLAQTIVLSQVRDHPIRLTGPPLRLEFDKVFLRQPLPTQGEHDIEITAEDLRFLAQDIWQVHPNVE
ncbi:hypothetical protein ASPVEDRAFT_880478 [Aspergillus versicolor CBS 583.65]|uniref:Uncharacterized protein n=1 Tax=Aspergillus versicolor CBS 583.65 TaxID=1036611 RepID=A0A1L9P8X6_ASPVE|nr:uncharacterized protein ASPVEDRAFT_880478 [Aspergillus versicolor CBS 583.65]OJI97990.1 hypothetical protein ASPVEDRAFT_880478 [Aspergillus versicolor CBS 583.65]